MISLKYDRNNEKIGILDKREILGKEVSTFGDIETPIFLAKDLANWIDHSNHRSMLSLVDDDEKIKKSIPVRNNYGVQNEETWFLTEDGVYEVLMQSRKPIAKQFKKKIKKMLKDLRLKNNAYSNLSKELQAIFIIDKKQQEIEMYIDDVRDNLEDFKQDIPLFAVECDEISRLVRRTGTNALKGKNSKAYKNKSIRSKVYSDIYKQLRREFGVTSYKAIKRRQLEQALKSVENYRLPIFLEEEINLINNYGSREDLVC